MLSFLRRRSISRLTLGGAGLHWVRENSFSSSPVERSVEESSPGGASANSPALQRREKCKRCASPGGTTELLTQTLQRWGKGKRESKSRRSLCHSVIASQKVECQAVPSREAAKECSPRRKPWVASGNRPSPEGAKEKVRHRLRRDDRVLTLLRDASGSALLEFAIVLPLLVVFVVGIYDFSGAFNQKQKMEQAAQEGAILAGAQPMSDIATTTDDPDSLHPVVIAVFNSLVGSGVVPSGTCTPPGTASGPIGLAWTYRISGCSSAYPADTLVVRINRGWVPAVAGTTKTVGTRLTVIYPYHWRFNRVIQLLFPGSSSYRATTRISETATTHNQL
jgi:TadE-like protein